MGDSKKYRDMSDDKLAEIQNGLLGKDTEDILIEREWRRRDRVAQHKLNLILLLGSILGATMSSLIGVFIGYFLNKCPR